MRRQRVVLALAVLEPDRVNRREIQDVEAHALHVGQMGDHVVERAVPVRVVARRAGGELVTSREAGGWGSGLVERGKSAHQAERGAGSRSAITVSTRS